MSDVATAPAALQSKPAAPLKSPAFKEATFSRNTWTATVDQGTTFDDLLRPDFWMHNMDRIRPADHIEVYFADGTGYAELVVRTTNRTGALTAFIAKVDFTQAEDTNIGAELTEYDVKFAGPHHKWRVIKKGVVDPIKTGFASEAAARTWLVGEYLTGTYKDGAKVAA